MTDTDLKMVPVAPTQAMLDSVSCPDCTTTICEHMLAAATKRQPLSSERIYEIGLKHKRIARDGFEWFDRESFARDIEAAHGITGE